MSGPGPDPYNLTLTPNQPQSNALTPATPLGRAAQGRAATGPTGSSGRARRKEAPRSGKRPRAAEKAGCGVSPPCIPSPLLRRHRPRAPLWRAWTRRTSQLPNPTNVGAWVQVLGFRQCVHLFRRFTPMSTAEGAEGTWAGGRGSLGRGGGGAQGRHRHVSWVVWYQEWPCAAENAPRSGKKRGAASPHHFPLLNLAAL